MANATMVEGLPVSSGRRILLGLPWRPPLWVACLGLTALILTYPVTLGLQSSVVHSPDIFPDLRLFGILFYLWAASLVVLFFTSADGRAARWERLALVALAALVFRGFWAMIAPIQHQSLLHATETKMWLGTGHIVRPGVYGDWPALSCVTAALSQVTGLRLFPAITVLTVSMVLATAVAAYLFFLAVLKSSLHASLACLLVLVGCPWLWSIYFPWVMALSLMVLFLVVLFRRSALRSGARSVVALLLFLAITATHMFAAILAFTNVVVIWGFGLLRRNRAESGISAVTLMLFFAILVSWHLYWATNAFESLTTMASMRMVDLPLSKLLGGVFSMGQASMGQSQGQSQVGATIPLWFSMTRLFWSALLYASAGVLWLWILRRFRRLDSTESKLVAVCLALGLASVPLVLLVQGTNDLRRPLMYGAFLGVPFLFLWLQKFRPVMRRAALAGLAFVLISLSLPSFLGNAFNAPRWMYYDSEYASGEWLQSMYGTGKGLNITGDVPAYWSTEFHVPEATYNVELSILEYEGWGAEIGWVIFDELLDRYNRIPRTSSPSLFVHTPKMVLYTGHIYGIPADDPRWGEITAHLSEGSHQVYDNGPIQVYSPG